MSSRTPNRKRSLSRKRILDDSKASGKISVKRLSPHIISDEEDDDGKEVFSPVISPMNKRSSKTKKGSSSKVGNIVEKDEPENSAQKKTDNSSSHSPQLKNLLFSPESNFTCSQQLLIHECEVIWDCNSPGYSRDDLKRMYKHKEKQEYHLPKRPLRSQNLFTRGPPVSQPQKKNCSEDVEEKLNDLLKKIKSDDEESEKKSVSIPDILCPSQSFDVTLTVDMPTQPFELKDLPSSSSQEQNKSLEIPDSEFDQILMDDIEKNRLTSQRSPESVSKCQSHGSLTKIPNEAVSRQIHLDKGKTTLREAPKTESNKIFSKNYRNVSNSDISSGKQRSFDVSDDFDDDIFSDSLLSLTQEMENALFDKVTGKYRSPSVLKKEVETFKKEKENNNSKPSSSPRFGKARSLSYSKSISNDAAIPSSTLNKKMDKRTAPELLKTNSSHYRTNNYLKFNDKTYKFKGIQSVKKDVPLETTDKSDLDTAFVSDSLDESLDALICSIDESELVVSNSNILRPPSKPSFQSSSKPSFNINKKSEMLLSKEELEKFNTYQNAPKSTPNNKTQRPKDSSVSPVERTLFYSPKSKSKVALNLQRNARNTSVSNSIKKDPEKEVCKNSITTPPIFEDDFDLFEDDVLEGVIKAENEYFSQSDVRNKDKKLLQKKETFSIKSEDSKPCQDIINERNFDKNSVNLKNTTQNNKPKPNLQNQPFMNPLSDKVSGNVKPCNPSSNSVRREDSAPAPRKKPFNVFQLQNNSKSNDSKSNVKCTAEEIARKREEALRRRRDKSTKR